MMDLLLKPTYFPTPAAFRAWLEQHHNSESELLVGFYKKDSAKPSITWPESVDLALAFGWIDGVRRRIDDESYCIRFTPRKPNSIWSNVNIGRATELIRRGEMAPAGLKVFSERNRAKSQQYSFEQSNVALPPEMENVFRKQAIAWKHFQSQPPSYRKRANWWVISAKRDVTREKRLAELIEASARGERVRQLVSPAKQTKKKL